MSLSSILLKKLREHQLRNIIKIFNDELKGLKDIFNKIKELEWLGDQEINELKNETKRKLDMLDDEISDILEKSDVILTKKKKRELRLLAKDIINEIERLKEKVWKE